MGRDVAVAQAISSGRTSGDAGPFEREQNQPDAVQTERGPAMQVKRRADEGLRLAGEAMPSRAHRGMG